MKKTFLYLFTAFILATVMTSCLGDTSATMGREGNFVIIRNEEGKVQAWTEAGIAVTFDGINSYGVNDILIADFEVDMGNMSSPGIYDAKPFTPRETYEAREHLPVNNAVADTLAESNPFKFNVLNVRKFSGNEYFKDRWLFHAESSFREGQYINPQFIYDKDKQVDNKGNALPENNYIIDVKLNLGGTPNPGASESNKQKDFVVDFSNFRNQIKSDIKLGETEVVVKIWFRFYKNTDTTKPTYDQNMGGFIFPKASNS